MAMQQQMQDEEDNIWDLCRELEELGGGIQTRLERVSYLKLLKKSNELDAMLMSGETNNANLPPYLIVQDNNVTGETIDCQDEDDAQDQMLMTRQLQVGDIYGFIEENLTRFSQLNFNTTMIFYGARDAGKSTFLFQTSFFNMLTDQLFGTNSEGLTGLHGAWLQAYEIGIDQRTRVEKKTNLLNFANEDEKTVQDKKGNSASKANSSRG